MTENAIDERTYCAVHPDRETGLRCNKCGRLMCTDCAVQTPVGYRCRECVRGIQQKFYTATPADRVRVALVCGAVGGGATMLVSALNLPLLFLLLLGLPIGGALAELALRLVSKRRGERMDVFAAGGAVVGGLLAAVGVLLIRYTQQAEALAARGLRVEALSLDLLVRALLADWVTLVFVGLVAAAVYGRFKLRS